MRQTFGSPPPDTMPPEKAAFLLPQKQDALSVKIAALVYL